MTRTQKQTEDFVHIIKYIINTKILNQQDKIYICGVWKKKEKKNREQDVHVKKNKSILIKRDVNHMIWYFYLSWLYILHILLVGKNLPHHTYIVAHLKKNITNAIIHYYISI